MTSITKITIMSNGNTKTIKIDDGLVLVRNGRATKFKAIEECSVKELLINADGKNGRS